MWLSIDWINLIKPRVPKHNHKVDSETFGIPKEVCHRFLSYRQWKFCKKTKQIEKTKRFRFVLTVQLQALCCAKYMKCSLIAISDNLNVGIFQNAVYNNVLRSRME